MDFVQEASRLAELGFHVFPCADPRIDKADVGKRGKRPLSKNGCNSATLDFAQIETWGNLYPTANIGITCFNCFVIDVDDKDGKSGSSDLQSLIDRFGPLPDGPIAKTGSGGYHRFFAKPQEDIVGTTGLLFEGRKTGLDIRVGSQYVVAPPSLHECGNQYEWIKPLGAIEELPELPISWIEKVFKRRVESLELKVESGINSTFNSKLSTLERAIAYLDKVSPAVQGANGHNTLLWAATCLIHGFGLNSNDAESLLTNHYNPRCVPPWDLANSLQYRDFVRKIEQAEIKNPNKEPLWLLNNQSVVEHNVDLSGIMDQVGTKQIPTGNLTIITEPKVSKPPEAI